MRISPPETTLVPQFVETVALGPGMWTQVPLKLQQTFIENAPTFLDEANDLEQLAFDLEWIRGFSKPTLLTLGEASPPTFAPVVARLAAVLPHAKVVTLLGAGHIPHETHAYVKTLVAFTRQHKPDLARGTLGNRRQTRRFEDT